MVQNLATHFQNITSKWKLSGMWYQILEFLYQQYSLGIGYNALNTTRSVLSSFISINITVGQIPIICRFMKYEIQCHLGCLYCLALPQIIISCEHYTYNVALSKICHAADLAVGQHGQTVHLLDVCNIMLSQGYTKFTIGDTINTTRPGCHVAELAFHAHAPDRQTSVCNCSDSLPPLLEVRGKGTQLILTLNLNGISQDTLRWWLREALCNAGIDLAILSPHSTSSASTSAAAQNKIPLLFRVGGM